MHQRGVPVVVGHVDAKEVDVDRVLPPHLVEHHHHLDIMVHCHGDVRVLHDGNPHPATRQRGTKWEGVTAGQLLRLKAEGLPILPDLCRGPPGERVVVPAVAHADAVGADGHADPIGLVVDGDGAEVGAELVFEHLLGADQLTVHHQTFRRGGGMKYGG